MQPHTTRFPELSGFNANLAELLNLSTACLEPEERFLQIGCFRPYSLAAALAHNREVMAYAVEDFQKYDPSGERLEAFSAELTQYNCHEQACLCDEALDEFWQEFPMLDTPEKIGVYYYDSLPEYRSVLLGLLGVKNYLSNNSLLVITNIQEVGVNQAVQDFLLTHPEAFPLLAGAASDHGILGLGKLCLLGWRGDRVYPLLKTNKKILLHVGCGPYRPEALPEEFSSRDWQEIRLDIDAKVHPDMLAIIIDLSVVGDNSVEGIFSSHNLEHIYDYEVPIALGEFLRVLKPEGMLMIVVSDMKRAAEWVARGDMDEEPLYISPGGPVKALWMFYGMGTPVPNQPYMAHKTGFTAASLQPRLEGAGFTRVEIRRRRFDLVAYAYKPEL
jgi:hypothetical protein